MIHIIEFDINSIICMTIIGQNSLKMDPFPFGEKSHLLPSRRRLRAYALSIKDHFTRDDPNIFV